MKKILLALTLFSVAFLALASYTTNVFANDRPNHGRGDDNERHNGNYNPDKQLSKSSCGQNLGNPVIDVTQKVQNDVDSGDAGNYWAFDYYTRHIKVWQTVAPVADGDGTYCAIVTYDGSFYAVPGQIGPGNFPVGALINTPTDSPVHGGMSGGRRATVVGTLLTTPLWPTNGSVGTTNYQCNISGTCPGLVSWAGQYFNSGVTNTDVWWGWKYTGGSHGTWINSLDGNSGNIL